MKREGSEMWQNTLIACVVVVCGTVAWIVYEVEKRPTPCAEEVHDPRYFTQCGDPRARIVVPPGWTWFKCECPEGSR